MAITTRMTAVSTGVGLFASAVQNSLAPPNTGFMGVFTRTGGTIAILGKSWLLSVPERQD